MSERNSRARTDDAGSPSGGNFHGYLVRNLSGGYRLAVMTLDDQIGAQAVVRGATMAAWLAAADGPEDQLDAAFRRRLAADLQPAIRTGKSADGIGRVAVEPLGAAIAGLHTKAQIALARGFGPWDPPGFGADPREAGEALRALRDRLAASDAPVVATGNLESSLRALYESRDPGEPAPLPLRLRADAITGHTRFVMHDGDAPSDDPVEEGGFADVGASHDGD